jgi:hypothetical protein
MCATVALEIAILSLVFVAEDNKNSRQTLVGILLATSYVVFTVFLCSLVRNRILRSATKQQDVSKKIEIGEAHQVTKR